MEESEKGASQAQRPTPVRIVMESAEAELGEGGSPLRSFQDPVSGQEWIARISGRSISGVVPLRVIPLMEVGFARAEEPATVVLRAVRPGESLDDLDDEGLLRLFHSAGPFSRPAPEAPAPEARRGKNRSTGRRTG